MADAHRSHRMAGEDLFVALGLLALPDAIDSFRYWASERDDLSGFERYALRLFDELDLERLRAAYDAHEVHLAYISRMEAFYLGYSGADMEPGCADELVLLQAETVVNRLARLFNRIGDAEPSEEACSVLDFRAFQRTTSAVADMLSAAGEHNPWACPGTVRCAPGGEWDVRTRIARACEAFSPITRLDYRFDCDAAAGLVAMQLTCPDVSAMPRSYCDEETAEWHSLGRGARGRMAHEHACRISLVMAAAAFSAGMRIKRCSVEVQSVHDHRPLFTVEFERTFFFSVVAPFAQTLTKQSMLSPVCSRMLQFEQGERVVSEQAAAARRVSVGEDTRELPPELRTLLLADRMCELEVLEPPSSPSMRCLAETRDVVQVDPVQAVDRLNNLISELEAACAVEELESEAPLQTQFCEDSIDRVLVGLLEDDTATRVHRAPDALYHALHELVTLYLGVGEPELALGPAQQLVDLAATSASAHFALIKVLTKLGRYTDAIEVCRHGMRVAYDAPSIAYYYYRLAFAYWAVGDRKTALACYRMVPLGQPISSAAQAEMRTLMGKMRRQDPPTREEAEGVLRAAGVPIAPVDEVANQIADTAVLLADHGFFPLAQACVTYMWRVMGNDELGVLSASFRPL